MLFFEGTIPSERLDRVVREIRVKAPANNFQEAMVGAAVGDNDYDPSVRSVKSYFPPAGTLPYTIRLCNEIITEHLPGTASNKLELGNTPELQLLKYSPGDFFKKHKDTIRGERRQHFTEDLQGHFRMFTMCIQLTPADDYKGGELVVYNNYTDKEIMRLKKHRGAYVLFPSLSYHEAKKVKSGSREALTCWFVGRGKDNVWLQEQIDKLQKIEDQ